MISLATLPPLATIPPALRPVLDAIILAEGAKFENDPNDSGGATKCGISLAFARDARIDVDDDGDTDIDDIKAVDATTAQRIIYELFYRRTGLGRLPGPLQASVLDMAFNMGLGGARSVLTAVLTWAGRHPDHGGLNPGFGDYAAPLAAAIAQYGASPVEDAVVHARIARYRQIVSARPTSAKFLNGWTLRALHYGSLDLRSRYGELLAQYHEKP